MMHGIMNLKKKKLKIQNGRSFVFLNVGKN